MERLLLLDEKWEFGFLFVFFCAYHMIAGTNKFRQYMGLCRCVDVVDVVDVADAD